MIRFTLAALAVSAAALADAPTAQYTLRGAGTTQTVFDQRTGLEWTRSDLQSSDFVYANCRGSDQSPSCTWKDALDNCAALNAHTFAGHADWRLPSVKELQTLVDRRYGSYGRAIDGPAFPTLPGGVYQNGQTVIAFWTSTPLAVGTATASQSWYVDFSTGFVQYATNSGSAAFRAYARCVRSSL